MELPSHMDPGFFLYFVGTRMTATRGGCHRHDDTKKQGTQKQSSRSAPTLLLFLTVGASFRVSGNSCQAGEIASTDRRREKTDTDTQIRREMFSNAERQKERTGKYGTSRDEFLQELVTQFQQTVSEETKEQVVAHLANFAYDPFNYDILRKLHVLDLFMDCLTEANEKLIEFGVGGLCNCSPDPANRDVIVKNGGIPLIISCLSSPVENTVLSAIATLYYLCTPLTKKDILTPEVVECMKKYASIADVNVRFSNLAQAFLDKHVNTRTRS